MTALEQKRRAAADLDPDTPGVAEYLAELDRLIRATDQAREARSVPVTQQRLMV